MLRHYKIELEDRSSFVTETEKSMFELAADCKANTSIDFYDCIAKRHRSIKTKEIRSFERLYKYAYEKEMIAANDKRNAGNERSRKKAQSLS
jgi:hypothetical protein